LASTEAPSASRLKLQKQLKTAESSVLVQARTERRQWRRGTRLSDLVSEPSSAATTAKWIIQSGRLGQFKLASKVLYSRQSSIGS
jgi:hypothetical protein